MTANTKVKADVKVLKGQEAEDAVLEYLKMMNRPFGAVDVSSNLKGAKTYGKTTFFVYNQAKTTPDIKTFEEENKALSADVKTLNAELGKLNNALTDQELEAKILETRQQSYPTAHLVPLRLGTCFSICRCNFPELAQLDSDWAKWRTEWVRRRKIFNELWGYATDQKTRSEADEFREDLGIEVDTPEH
ncbi:TBPIP-domain-containing protein [Flagelloscypha sp. PMI_526]|nr:TBPIP-domain-containing protein [Flagelloscypha sp. PMI_526]